MSKEFKLTTDGSGSALGYLLGQTDDTGNEYAATVLDPFALRK